VNADSVAEWWKKAPREELYSLSLVKATRARQEGLKTIGVLLDCARTPAFDKLEHWGRTEGRTKPQVQELLESPPRRCALVFLELVVSQLRDVVHMV
jgi:hypothetical protein